MRRIGPALLLLLAFLPSCSSMQSDSGKGRATAEVPLPGLEIRQVSAVPSTAAHVTGGLPVQYAFVVENRAPQPITLKRVNLVSMGYGAYDVSASMPFKTVVQPGQTETVQFWAPANISTASVVGANGPVTLRVTAQFDSPMGQFQEVVVQQVNATNGVEQ